MSDKQHYCLACGELVGHVGRVCSGCLWDDREDDHDVHIPNMQSRAVDA